MNVIRKIVNGVTVEYTVDGINRLGLDPETPRRMPPSMAKLRPWPMVLLPLKVLAKPDDRGAGDIIARVIGPIGGDAFKAWYKTLFGRNCGCGHRQEVLNLRWPL